MEVTPRRAPCSGLFLHCPFPSTCSLQFLDQVQKKDSGRSLILGASGQTSALWGGIQTRLSRVLFAHPPSPALASADLGAVHGAGEAAYSKCVSALWEV